MIHYGDITKINGYDVPIVDCIIGGSPCQDLSVAGKRKGLEGERSGLFMEQLRIVKEMRDKDARSGRTDEYIRPRFMVWENVPGTFPSNKGEDFRNVLEEITKVVEKDAVIPRPPKNKWSTSGAIVGDGWSIAWRVCDAQFYGVPQRRRRISLVADFGGGCAPEILFERKGLRRDSEESGAQRKRTSADAEGCTSVYDREGRCLSFHLLQDVITSNKISPCLSSGNPISGQASVGVCIASSAIALEPGIASREGGHIYEGVSGTLRANAGDNQMSVAYCYDARGNGDGKVCCTLTGDHQNRITDYSAVVVEGLDCYNQQMTGNKSKSLTSVATDSDHIPCVVESVGCDVYNLIETGDVSCTLTTCSGGSTSSGPSVIVMDRSAFNQGENAKYNIGIDEKGVAFSHNYIVRRLTPLECERLQGFPDGWTDIGEYTDSKGKKKKTSDSARYKALGNSIALPPWKWVIKRLCSHYERDATMASLFDGIGGFPHLWEQINGKGSCLWASEIEDFPIAVTKERIG